MFKDYYAILEIAQTATLSEIKTAYKTQAIKWHPDKNPGMDTTEKMKDINEAKLILTDVDARARYDIEYLKFKSYQQAEEGKDNTRTKQTSSTNEDFSSYEIDDEILKRWMENAKRQAMRNLYAMVNEFRESSIIGFGAFFNNAIKFIVIAAIVLIMALILKSF